MDMNQRHTETLVYLDVLLVLTQQRLPNPQHRRHPGRHLAVWGPERCSQEIDWAVAFKTHSVARGSA